MRRPGPSRRRGPVIGALVAAVLVAGLPAFANTPEAGQDPSVTLTVTPANLVFDGQTVSVTGTGFPPGTPGTVRQCGGSVGEPQCDLAASASFVTTGTGVLPPTSVTVKRIIDTGTTTFNCGVQACALVATAGGRTSQHRISILGAGTIVPTSTSTTSTSTTSTSTPTSTTSTPTSTTSTSTTSTPTPTTIPPTTTSSLPAVGPDPVCSFLRLLLGPFPFLRGPLDSLLALLNCPAR